MKQKYLLLTMILLIFLFSATSLSVLAVTPNLELTPPTQSVTVGNQANINVEVAEVTDLRGANIILNFDASKLQYVSSTNGGFIPSATLLEQLIDNTSGSVTLDIAGLGASAYASGSGTIMTVIFNRIATGDTNITFGSTTLKDKDNITITHTKGNGCLMTSLIGDFNSGGCVEFEDLMIFAMAYGSCQGDANWNPVCDLNSGGCIEFEDLMLFAMHYGLCDEPCPPPSAPILSDPGSSVDLGTPYDVCWSAVSGATGYKIQEATSSDFSSGLQEYPVTDICKSFSHNTADTYYYRVAAVDSCGQSGWSNIEDIVIPPPDSGNKVFLESGGTLNGTSINPSNPTLTVNSGESITGTLKVQAIYSGPSGNVVPFGYTPSWGSHSSSYVTVISDLPVGTSPYDVSINLNAPTTSGTYYLIFASNAEMNLGWTMSQTNWTTGTMSWDDGNDIADLTESELQDSISTGFLYLDMLTGSTYSKSNYGIAYVKINVNEGCTSPPVSEVSALAFTYHSTMSKIQSKIDKLIEENKLHRSYPLVKAKRTTKADVVYEIYVEWAKYTGADGYKIFRSVNGGSYTLIAEGTVDPDYDYYSIWDTNVTAGSTYSYYVTAYATGWETCPSQSTSTTPLPSCSLISPTNGVTINNPTPAFSWSPVGVSSYPYGAISSGESDLYVYDETASSTSWWTYFTNMTTSSETYNQDGQATALVSGHNYTWNSWAYGYDGSGNRIAVSASEDWGFDYGIEPTRIIRLVGDLNFGDVQVGQSSQRTLTIYNDGNSTLTVNSISYPAGFTGPWNGTIPTESSHNVTVTFSPTEVKTYGGDLTVDSNATSGTNAKSVSGNGTEIPTVTTQDATNIETHSVIANGTITSDGGSKITEKGFEYGLTQTPTWSVKETDTDLGTGAFSNTISDLNSDTTYWVKAYAVNNEGKSVNEDWKEFHTLPDDIIVTNTVTFTCDGQQPVTSDCNITLQY